METFIGKIVKGRKSNLVLAPEEGIAIFESEEGGQRAKVVWTNHPEISKGDSWILAVQDAPAPKTKVKAFRDQKDVAFD